jgi:hypothetical protein
MAVKILALCDYEYWAHKIPPCFPAQVVALGQRPEVEAIATSGPGWHGWVQADPLAANVARAVPWTPDILYFSRPKWWGGYYRGYERCDSWPGVKVGTYEHREEFVLSDAARLGLSRILYYYPGWRAGAVGADVRARELWLPIPDALFASGSRPHHERHYDAILSGNREPWVYPVRAALADAINGGAIARATVRSSLGYKASNLVQAWAEWGDYAAALADARIAFVTPSRYNMLLRKYVEAMAAGCLPIGPIPTCAPAWFNDVVIEARTAPECVAAARKWMDRETERETRAQYGRDVVLQSYTYRAWAEQWLQAIR